MLCGTDCKLGFILESVHEWKEVVRYPYFMEPPNVIFTICCWLDFKVTGHSCTARFAIDL
jgi:hypothetical protein